MNPLAWLKNGRMPSLWTLARLQLALGVISIAAGVLLGCVAAGIAIGFFGKDGAQVAVAILISAFTFSTTAAILLFGAAVTAYCASRDDREREGRWQNTEPPLPAGGPPLPQTPPPFRAPTTLLGRDRKAFEDDYRP